MTIADDLREIAETGPHHPERWRDKLREAAAQMDALTAREQSWQEALDRTAEQRDQMGRERDALTAERADPERWASVFLDHPDEAFRQQCINAIGEGWHEEQLEALRAERDALATTVSELDEGLRATLAREGAALQQCASGASLLEDCEALIASAAPLSWSAGGSLEDHAVAWEKDAEKLLARIRAAVASTPSAQNDGWAHCPKCQSVELTDLGQGQVRCLRCNYAFGLPLAQESSATWDPVGGRSINPDVLAAATGNSPGILDGSHVPRWVISCPCGNYFQPCDGIGGNKCSGCGRVFELPDPPGWGCMRDTGWEAPHKASPESGTGGEAVRDVLELLDKLAGYYEDTEIEIGGVKRRGLMWARNALANASTGVKP